MKRILPFVLVPGVAGALAVGTAGVPEAHGAGTSSACTDSSPDCVISTASKYIHALVTHAGSTIPLAPHAYRTENGMVTGTSGPGIQNDVSTNKGDRAISDVRDVRWFVAGDEATAYYLMDTTAPNNPSAPHTTTEHLAERFKVDHGLIRQIEAVFWINPGLAPDSSGWPPPTGEG
jgi:hypothetical protein